MKRFLRETSAVAEVELIKLIRDPTEVFSRAIQPVLWLAVFDQVIVHAHGIYTGEIGYLAVITPGILAQSVLFSSIFYGIAVIWERDLGVVHKLLVSPARRSSLVFGKAVSAGFRRVDRGIQRFAGDSREAVSDAGGITANILICRLVQVYESRLP